LVSIGVRYWGTYRRVPDNYAVVANRIYESRCELNQELPPEIALSFLYDWRNKLEVEHGVKTQYIEVTGKKATVQWYVAETSEIATVVAQAPPAVPGVAVSTIVALIAAAFLGVAVGYALSQLAITIKETGELISVLGPENVSMFLNVITFAMMLYLMSPMISLITGMVERVVRRR